MNFCINAFQETTKRSQSLAMMSCLVDDITNEWWIKALKLDKDLENLCDELVTLIISPEKIERNVLDQLLSIH
jgi:hypothetical protein